MKAWLWERYGGPETLRLADVPKPAPGEKEALVEVRAASVNAADWHSLRGKPLFSRLTPGLRSPKHRTLGVDVAGRIESLGAGVDGLGEGDEVYANLLDHGYGGFAEYVSVPVDALALKPARLSFLEAAAVPMAGVTALQGLAHHGPVHSGQKLLINGGSGGVGTFAVQLANASEADVTVVTSTPNLDLVRALGADAVVDYRKTDPSDGGAVYDLILDTVGNLSLRELEGMLADGGRAAITGFSTVAHLLGVSLRGGKRISQVTAHATTADLERLSELIDSGAVRPVIDQTYEFDRVPDAIAYVEKGHAKGKVVVSVP